jgi:predicted RNA-binding protein Jag
MKRKDIEVGKEYVVYSPNVRSPFYDGRRARVLDTEPVWAKASGFGYHRETPKVKVKGFDGKTIEARDYTRKVSGVTDLDGPAARNGVKVFIQGRYSSLEGEVAVVPISNIQKPWAEFATEKAKYEKDRDEQYKKDRLSEQRLAQRGEYLETLAQEQDLTVRVRTPYVNAEDVMIELDGADFERLIKALR